MKNKSLIITLPIIITFLIAGSIGWLVFSSMSPSMTTKSSTQTNTNIAPSESNNNQTTPEDPSTISADQLALKNGKNKQACWVVVDGIVYEIGGFALWADGLHRPSGGKAMCGKDLSSVINQSPHGKSKLKLLKEVGKFSN